MTFNSSRVLRHMVKVFYCTDIHHSVKDGGKDTNPIHGGSGSGKDMSRRALRLYVQVVGKAWAAWKQGAGVAGKLHQVYVMSLTDNLIQETPKRSPDRRKLSKTTWKDTSKIQIQTKTGSVRLSTALG